MVEEVDTRRAFGSNEFDESVKISNNGFRTPLLQMVQYLSLACSKPGTLWVQKTADDTRIDSYFKCRGFCTVVETAKGYKDFDDECHEVIESMTSKSRIFACVVQQGCRLMATDKFVECQRNAFNRNSNKANGTQFKPLTSCLLYTSDAADD